MIFSSKHHFIFIANGKTGTTSLENQLSHYDEYGEFVGGCRGLFFGKHVPSRVLRELTGHAMWNSCFKFGFVRNPWDRLVSMYHDYRDSCVIHAAKVLRHPRSSIRSVVRARSYGIPDVQVLDTNVIHRIYDLQREMKSCMSAESSFQYTMFMDEHEQPIVDYIGRYESLQQDMKVVLDRIGLKPTPVPHLNRAVRRRHYREYYDAEGRELVRRLYQKDIDLFGYDF